MCLQKNKQRDKQKASPAILNNAGLRSLSRLVRVAVLKLT